ncbi:MAG: histidine kinase [Flavobacteriales bacterium]|nr:histidine kinase [Flavobacteriales bacterium]
MSANFMMSKQRLYWICQGLGWSSFVLIIWAINQLEGAGFDMFSFISLLIMTLLGILISHTYRELIIQLDWLRFKIVDLIPRVALTSVLCGVAFFFLHRFLYDIVVLREKVILSVLDLLEGIVSLSVFFILWSTLYFLFHFIQNYRKEEIKNLRWQALSTEVELNKLKSQLNPHFIFNSMNSIRALVDEDPEKSKDSITQLSNILRSSLLMGRQKVIPLSQELQLVRDYLSLEQTRFEERLRTSFEINKEVKEHHVPPLLLQTLVENGIKHGISQLEEGGEIIIRARKKKDDLILSIEDTGHFREKKERSPGFGLLNSRQRLFLLYGERGNLRISNTENNTVLVEVLIPKQPKELLDPDKIKES